MSVDIEIPPVFRRPPIVSRPALLSVHSLPRRRISVIRPVWGLTLVLGALAAVWLLLGAWAAWARVDSYTSGTGRIVPAQTVQAVQTLEGGILSDLPVSEGALVDEGQVVARISDVAAMSEYQQLRTKYLAGTAAITRLEAEMVRRTPAMSGELESPEGRPFALRELELFRARMGELTASIQVIERQRDQHREELYGVEERIRGLRDALVPLKQELNLTAELAEKGHKPRIELIRMQQRVSDTESQIRAATGQMPAIRAAIRESEQRMDERQRGFDSQVRSDLAQRQADVSASMEALRNLRDRVDRRELRAPVRGEIKQIRLKTIGGVLQPGQTLMEIVPVGDAMVVEVPIAPTDIAFVTHGMPARIKVTAYDHTLHGWLPGTVEHVSADAIVNEKGDAFFQVRVRPERDYLGTADRPLRILPGMMANVDVITGNRTILQYLLKPVLKAKDKALTER